MTQKEKARAYDTGTSLISNSLRDLCGRAEQLGRWETPYDFDRFLGLRTAYFFLTTENWPSPSFMKTEAS